MTRIVDPIIDSLRQMLLEMGNRAEAILVKSLRSVFERDPGLAREISNDDLEIDRIDVSIDEAVIRALALQAPVADDLRQIISIKMIATDLERVGDLARNISKASLRLSGQKELHLPPTLEELADGARRQLRSAMDSFSDSDGDRAQVVLQSDDQIDADQDVVVREAIAKITKHHDRVSEGVDYILIAKSLERVADHATNIAESVILWTEGRNVKHASKLNG